MHCVGPQVLPTLVTTLPLQYQLKVIKGEAKYWIKFKIQLLINSLKCQRQKKAEVANSVNLDEVAHNEPPHLNLHCLPSSL